MINVQCRHLGVGAVHGSVLVLVVYNNHLTAFFRHFLHYLHILFRLLARNISSPQYHAAVDGTAGRELYSAVLLIIVGPKSLHTMHHFLVITHTNSLVDAAFHGAVHSIVEVYKPVSLVQKDGCKRYNHQDRHIFKRYLHAAKIGFSSGERIKR